MDTNSDFNEKNLASSLTTDNPEVLSNNAENPVNQNDFLLPRSAWNSQVAYLRLIFKAKKALDKIELEQNLKS